VIIASDSPRTQETALLLTGIQPVIDTRAGFLMASANQSDLLNNQAKLNPLGFVGALYEMQDLRVDVEKKAGELVDLINETLDNLSPNENALIVTHEITMVPAEQLLNNQKVELPIKGVPYLGGYIVEEDKKVTNFD
jgi:broad specificity phosphatase PhoE